MIARLLEAPQEFSFFQAIRLFELARHESGSALDGALRLRPSTSLGFPAAEVAAFEPPPSEGKPYRLATTVMGLYGATSPLPACYSHDIVNAETREPSEQDPVRLFLDVIHHRLLTLLYRSWLKYRWWLRFEADASDPISSCMLHLIGLGDPETRDRLGLPARRLLRYAGYITQLPHTMSGLAAVISDYFEGIPVRIEPCLERWVSISSLDQNRLGETNSVLGESFTLGERVLDCSGKLGIVIGPLGALSTFTAFLPGGEQFRALRALLGFLITDPLEYDLELGLCADQVPPLSLTAESDAPGLGSITWLQASPADVWERFALSEAEVE